MSYRDPKSDRELADALRHMGAVDRVSPREMHLLARRIVRHAEPMLRARRRTAAWWEYAATWARALVPLGLSAATLATIGLLWLIPPRPSAGAAARPKGERSVLLSAATNRMPSHQLLDIVVAPPEDRSASRSPAIVPP